MNTLKNQLEKWIKANPIAIKKDVPSNTKVRKSEQLSGKTLRE